MPPSSPFPGAKRSYAESREHERGLIASTAHLLLPGQRIVEARALDLSTGGVRLVAPINLPLRTVCGVRLTVPGIPSGARIVMARAQVMNIVFSGKESGFVLGLRFITISRPALAAIEQYLHEKFTNMKSLARPRRPAGAPAPASQEAEPKPAAGLTRSGRSPGSRPA